MQNRKTIFAIGLLIFFLPIFGFPRAFESFLNIICGLLLMFFAGRKTFEKRIIKGKTQRKRIRNTADKNPAFVDSDGVEAYKAPLSSTINEVSEPEIEKTE